MEITLVKTRDGKKVVLHDKQWKHIKHRHPEMANRLSDIEDAVRNPTSKVRHSDTTAKFYKL